MNHFQLAKTTNYVYPDYIAFLNNVLNVLFFLGGVSFIDLNKQAVIYKAKALKQIQINLKGQP